MAYIEMRNVGGHIMLIQSFSLHVAHIPLKKPFVTAIRSTNVAEVVRVALYTKEGAVGWGEAAATAMITGETIASIKEAIEQHIAPAIIGLPVANISQLSAKIQSSIYGNHSAKAAVEIACYDLWAKHHQAPLYQLLGGHTDTMETDLTISIGTTEAMANDALAAINSGFRILKIKTGTSPTTDAQTIIDFWHEIKGNLPKETLKNILLRIDANQGWSVQNAIKIAHKWAENAIPIDLIEQPTPAWDIDSLAQIQAHTTFPIAADESVFSAKDALKCIQRRAARVINIKLMKTGGICHALDICTLCRIYDVECMIGCMLEGEISASAAAHLAASQPIVTRIDIDSPLLCEEGFYAGGPIFQGRIIAIPGLPGIGIEPSVGANGVAKGAKK